ncbi:MAG: metallophosphoesterase family protein [Nocardioidaceae bacterium]
MDTRDRVDGGRLRSVPRRLVTALVVVGAAAVGGLALGSTWASTVQNSDYRVSTRLIARSEVEIPTNIGTATFDTHLWGPGAEITVSALALPPVERSAGAQFIDLRAELEEITAMAREAGLRSLWKFVAGAVGGVLLGIAVRRGVARPHHAQNNPGSALRTVAGGLAAAVATSVAWCGGTAVTFDDHYGGGLEADGLLAVGMSTGDLLQELNSRDQAYAGYVQSLATYITELREAASPAATAPVAVRALLVSDLHGRNVYPQLRRVVESQRIDFVVDAGDLAQWGTGVELSARPELVRGIESLGVPYVFVKGNHDGPATVAELEEIPNVVVLDGRVTELAGLSLLGVPDPRLYQDGGPVESEDPGKVEQLERRAAEQAVRALPAVDGQVDLAVMHHPSGAVELAELTDAPVSISGHTHRPALVTDQNRLDITVGTTGAAGIRTFVGQRVDGKFVPIPQSFDIIDFGSHCHPVSLTRFSYPDVLSDTGNVQVTYRTFPVPEETESTAASAAGHGGVAAHRRCA